MAGGEGAHHPVRIDPAIERWAHMRENVYQSFRLTPRASRQVFLLAGLVPVTIGWVLWKNDTTFDWAGKLRGESLRSKALAATKEAEE